MKTTERKMTNEEIRVHNARADKLQKLVAIVALIFGTTGAIMAYCCAGTSDTGNDTPLTWVLLGVACILEVLSYLLLRFLDKVTS